MNQITPFYVKEPSATELTSWLYQAGMYYLYVTGEKGPTFAQGQTPKLPALSQGTTLNFQQNGLISHLQNYRRPRIHYLHYYYINYLHYSRNK